jgi:acylglycerol lipase
MLKSTLSPPVIPVTDPGTAAEDTFKSSKDDLTLYLKRWTPTTATTSSTPPRALIVFVHGFLEYYARYDNIFPLFAQSNIAVTAFDQRGFGKSWTQHSTPKKAHGNTTWKQQFEDVEDLIRLERGRLDAEYGKDKVPIYVMGHSMVSVDYYQRVVVFLKVILIAAGVDS